MLEKHKELYIKFNLGFGVVFAYAIILIILVFFAEIDHPDPIYALYIYCIGAVINLLLSIIIIRFGKLNGKNLSWHITYLAFAHTPSIIALFFAILYLFGQSIIN